jgi:hypothetical protein
MVESKTSNNIDIALMTELRLRRWMRFAGARRSRSWCLCTISHRQIDDNCRDFFTKNKTKWLF